MIKQYYIYTVSYVLLFTLFSESAKAQFFGLKQSNPRNYYHTVLKFPKDSLYRVYSVQYPSSASNNTIQPIIYVFGQNLKLKDSILLPKNHAFNFSGPIELNNKLFWMAANNSFTCGFIGLEVCYGDTISTVTFDMNYQFISKKRITTDTNYDHPKIVKFPGGFFYAHQKFTNFPIGTHKIYKLTSQLNVTDSAYINSCYGNPISLIHNKVFLPGEGMPLPCQAPPPNSGVRCSLILDSSLTAIGCDSYSNLGTFTYNTSPPVSTTLSCFSNPLPYLAELSQTKYLIFGNFLGLSSSMPTRANHGIVASIKNTNNQVIKTNLFLNKFYETSYSEVGNFYDVEKNQIAFVARVDSLGSGNFNPSQNLHSKIMVVKMDTMGNVLWQKYYGGEQYYQPRGLIFTPDGGLLVSGIRFDSTASAKKGMPGISESFLLKLDSAGNYNSVGIIEKSIKNNYTLKVHPNPANNQIQFDLPHTNTCAIVISALDGKQVYLNELYVINTPVNLEALAKGMYFYQIWTEKSFYTGKFLKE
jgi:hypothetical protein